MATTTAPKLSPAEIVVALKREPLVSTVGAARMLGMGPSNFLRDVADKLTQVMVEGSAKGPVKCFFKSEVKAFAGQRDRARAKRARSNGRH